ncbi:MAG: BBP7 family outer membrane beta-barrel protein [Gemmataceae bacterium]
MITKMRTAMAALLGLAAILPAGEGPACPRLIDFPQLVSPQAPCDAKPPCFWLEAEYLLWWVKNAPLPQPLVTTGPVNSFGILGQPGVEILGGNSTVNQDAFSGGRFALGAWVDDDRSIGVEGVAFFLGEKSRNFGYDSEKFGSPMLARPVINGLTNQESSAVVTYPSLAEGDIYVGNDLFLWGMEANCVGHAYTGGLVAFDCVLGYRFLNLVEHLDILANNTILPGGIGFFQGQVVPAGASLEVQDHFRTNNQFHGVNMGGRFTYRWERWVADVQGKVALGANCQTQTNAGQTLLNPGFNTIYGNGGLLVLPTNQGEFNRTRFAVVPEAGVNIACLVTHAIRFTIGYRFLYVSDVIRPGDQVSRVVNPRLVPTSPLFTGSGGPAVPQPTFQSTDFWAQGLTLGLGINF